MDDMYELRCLANTGRHGMQLAGGAGSMIEFSLQEGECIVIRDYRDDSPGKRFMYNGNQVRNFDYPHTLYKLTRTFVSAYQPGQ